MSSSIGELVIAMRRNFAKVDKLTQKPAALASLGYFAKQVEAAFILFTRTFKLIFTVCFGLSKHAVGTFCCSAVFIVAIFAKSSPSGYKVVMHFLLRTSKKCTIRRFQYLFKKGSNFSMDHFLFHWQGQFQRTLTFQVLMLVADQLF